MCSFAGQFVLKAVIEPCFMLLAVVLSYTLWQQFASMPRAVVGVFNCANCITRGKLARLRGRCEEFAAWREEFAAMEEAELQLRFDRLPLCKNRCRAGRQEARPGHSPRPAPLRRALLMPQVNHGPLSRCGERT